MRKGGTKGNKGKRKPPGSPEHAVSKKRRPEDA